MTAIDCALLAGSCRSAARRGSVVCLGRCLGSSALCPARPGPPAPGGRCRAGAPARTEAWSPHPCRTPFASHLTKCPKNRGNINRPWKRVSLTRGVDSERGEPPGASDRRASDTAERPQCGHCTGTAARAFLRSSERAATPTCRLKPPDLACRRTAGLFAGASVLLTCHRAAATLGA